MPPVLVPSLRWAPVEAGYPATSASGRAGWPVELTGGEAGEQASPCRPAGRPTS